MILVYYDCAAGLVLDGFYLYLLRNLAHHDAAKALLFKPLLV